jgi:hypothetical protein
LSARIPEARRGDPAEPAKTAAPEAVAAAAVPHVREVVQRHVIGRQLTLDLTPPMGLTVTVDGEPSRSVTTGDALAVDSSAHSLVFDCPVCISVRLALAAGDRDDTLVVAVPVKPATLVIEGDADNSYQIIQHPELSVRPGTNTIPLKSAFERIAVRQIETGVSVAVRLEAGKTMRASFAP